MKTVAITPAEVKSLIAVCGRGQVARRNRALLDVLFHAGLRISEATALRKGDVEGASIYVRCGKGGKSRTAAVVQTYGHWEAWLGECSDVIFATRTGDPISPAYVRALIRRLASRAKLTRRCHVHAFRHGHACELWKATRDLAIVSRQLGHARLSTTDTYLRGLGVDLSRVSELAF